MATVLGFSLGAPKEKPESAPDTVRTPPPGFEAEVRTAFPGIAKSGVQALYNAICLCEKAEGHEEPDGDEYVEEE